MENRRPLKARDWRVMKASAAWLARSKITPNQISLFSIAFAAFAGACLAMVPYSQDWGGPLFLPLLAALFILGRALCNLFDGMVAIEGSKKKRSGELFNDIPDRIADPIILISAGYAASAVAWGPTAGWCAGLLAVMTAYIRTLARSIGAPSNFGGPMSKVPRMALIAIACILTPIEFLFAEPGRVFAVTLVIISLGCIATVWVRVRDAYRFLESGPDA